MPVCAKRIYSHQNPGALTRDPRLREDDASLRHFVSSHEIISYCAAVIGKLGGGP